MEHNKVIEAMKELPKWQFILLWLWLWLVIMAIAPAGWVITLVYLFRAWKQG